MKAIRTDKDKRLVLFDTEAPRPERAEALVKVHAISLNRGEIRRSLAAPEGFRPGWDVAGVVETAAANGTGPKAGQRVVCFLPTAAWAERVAVPTDSMAVLPEAVSFAQAACLPVAGLTALHAVGKRGDLVSRKVLITGATGGVGHFASQLARLQGAHVVAVVRDEKQAAFARAHGASEVAVVGNEPGKAAAFGPYDLILESVGGDSFTASSKMLAPDGVLVAFGISGGTEGRIDLSPFYIKGGGSVYGLAVFHEVRREAASIGLARLLALVADKRLKVHLAVEKPWTAIDEVARDLQGRSYIGKAVLHVA
jgi:NADPH:quinone reductase-like Zn-dependent oxidoreductase